MTLNEYICMELQDFNKSVGELCDSAIVLINKESVSDVEAAKNEQSFLLYSNDRVRKLVNFCNDNKRCNEEFLFPNI